jgi:hypothetical protein
MWSDAPQGEDAALRFRLMIIMLAASLLAGCTDAATNACEQELIGTLKSPASYKRVKVERVTIPDSIHKPPYDEVTITYDAANSYNALLRDQYRCFYRPGTLDRVDPYGLGSGGSGGENLTAENLVVDNLEALEAQAGNVANEAADLQNEAADLGN